MDSERLSSEQKVAGSSPAEAILIGGVAQTEIERFSAKEQVEGSSPSVPISPKAER